MASDDGDRQFEPTQKRRDDFQKEGRFARARDAAAIASSLAVIGTVIGTRGAISDALRELAQSCFAGVASPEGLAAAAPVAVRAFGILSLPIALAAALAAAVVGVAQAGPRFDLGSVSFRVDRLSPGPRLSRLVSPKEAFVETALSLLRVAVVAFIAYRALRDDGPALLALARVPIRDGAGAAGSALLSVVLQVLGALALLSALDYAQSWFSLRQQLKMTRQELKEEMRSSDGDPQAKGRIRARSRALARSRAVSDVKKADVVVTNPTHVAVALRYAESDPAPIVVAKGHDEIALAIRAEARKRGIPIMESRALARALDAEVRVGKPIPGAHFAAVARVLAFVYRLKGRAPGTKRALGRPVSAEAQPASESSRERRADAIVPLGIIGIVLMMVLPIPAIVLDALLAFSVALAVGVFLTALYIEDALQFSAFPAFVLVATLLRLSLNVATTRLILLHGAEGPGAAGHVVEAFGRFVVGGNIVVGLVVFLILVVINFVVITKGAGRVAEVAARFTLDAMPGKQMAVDADVASGATTAEEARKRRRTLEREADFYGAMDGASKFVHGDAVAGLLITAINLVGGLVLGIAAGLDIGKAAETFSVLSVGDALVSQIPALLVSAASGIVVTRSATGEQMGRAFATQLLGRRRPVTLTAGILTVLAFMPGMPAIPCLGIALGLFVLSRKLPASDAATKDPAKDPRGSTEPRMGAPEDVDQALSLDLLSLELGYEMVAVVDPSRGGTLLDRVAGLRSDLAKDLGVVVPPVHVTDNLELPPGSYRVLLSGNPIGSGECRAGRLLAVDPSGTAPEVAGEETRDPTFGLPALWVLPRDREMAEALGYTVVDHATTVATHLGELLRNHAHALLGRQEVQHLLDVLARTTPKLVDDVVPNLLSLGDVLRVLRNLVRERVSIRDLRTILEALAEISGQTKDPEQLTELVRERLSPHITARLCGKDGGVAVLTLDPRVEDSLRRSLRDIAGGAGGALDAELLRNLTSGAERAIPKLQSIGAPAVVVCPPDLRRYVRAIFDRSLPDLAVVSFRELSPVATLRVVETLSGQPVPLF